MELISHEESDNTPRSALLPFQTILGVYSDVCHNPALIETLPEADLEKVLLKFFTCPICTKHTFSPIKQCVLGHSYCSSCFSNIKRCHVCRAPRSKTRSFAVERVASLLTFSCRFAFNGCELKGLMEDVRNHEKICTHSILSCPLLYNDCVWQGTYSDFFSHCKQHHPKNIYFKNRQRLLVSRFDELIDRDYYIVFNVFNHLFRCSWDLNESTGCMKFAVYLIGRSFLSSTKFTFEIGFLNRGTDSEIITLKGPCFQLLDDKKQFVDEKYLVVNYDMIRPLIDESGDLHYMVTINNNHIF